MNNVWFENKLKDDDSVGSIVPSDDFEVTTRILHPASVDDRQLRWSEAAAASSVSIKPSVQFSDFKESSYTEPPASGTLGGDWEVVLSLLEKAESDAPLFALWADVQGEFSWGTKLNNRPLEIDALTYDLVATSFELLVSTVREGSLLNFRGPNYLWPGDKKWLTASPYDAYSTFVAAPCQTALLFEESNLEMVDVVKGDRRCWELR